MSFDVFDIAASGMRAQRVKMDLISSNIANIHTTRNPDGSLGPYIKKNVNFNLTHTLFDFLFYFLIKNSYPLSLK